MSNVVTEKRLKVDFPITCTVENTATKEEIQLHGWVENLNGTNMQIELPLSSDTLSDDHLNYNIKLPQPFSSIAGQGKIQWKRQDQKNNHTVCDLELGVLSYQQTADLISVLEKVEKS